MFTLGLNAAKIRITSTLSCTKFNSQQLLLEQFFDTIGNFGRVQPESESTFPFQYNIMFSDGGL